ncbi:hypothetical protein LCGC14_2138050, partial [marine sediment metagenome]
MALTSKIPTFEELLKKVKTPKVPTITATGDLLDSDSASRLGYKIPSEWKVGQDITGTSLISPRGNIFKDIKLSPEGRIEDFKPFSAEGEPIKLPPVKPPPEPPPVESPPIETPPIEPLGDEIPGDLPPKGPLRDLFIQRLKAPLPEGQVDIERALRTERGISIREWEALGLTKEQRRSILKPGEEILFPLPSTTEGLQRVKIIGGEKPLKELTDAEFWEKVSETISALPGQTIFTIAGIPISAGTVTAAVLIAFGIYEMGNAGWNMLLDKVLKKPGDLNFLGRQLTRAGLNRNLNILERQRGVKIPAETRKSFINKYLSDMASSWERNVAGQGKAVNVQALQIASQNTYAQTANAVNREIQTLLPQAAQTGITMGGLAAEGGAATIQSIVQKITSNQPLNLEERQLYANQSQAVEDALKAQQVTPTPTTEAVVMPPTVTPEVHTVPERIAMPIEVQREQIRRGQAELDILPPGKVESNSIIAIRNGYVGTDAQGKVALVIQVTQEGVELKAGNVVAREGVPKVAIGRLLKQAEPMLKEAGITAPTEGLSPQGAKI